MQVVLIFFWFIEHKLTTFSIHNKNKISPRKQTITHNLKCMPRNWLFYSVRRKLLHDRLLILPLWKLRMLTGSSQEKEQDSRRNKYPQCSLRSFSPPESVTQIYLSEIYL